MKLTIEKSGRSEIIMVEGATQDDILAGSFRNFRGEKRKYNDAGKRNFNLALDLPVEALDQLTETGLKIKELAPKDEEYGDEPLRFVKVNVAFGGKFPPNLYLVSGNKMHELAEGELGLLDGSRFANVDLVIRTYHKDENSTTLYLQKGYFTIQQDPISAKYANMDIGDGPLDDEDYDEGLPFNED